MSYVNLDTLGDGDDENPIEEEYREMSKSLDFKKNSFNKVAPAQTLDETITRSVTSISPNDTVELGGMK